MKKTTKQYELRYLDTSPSDWPEFVKGNRLQLTMFCPKRAIKYFNFFKLEVSRDELAEAIKFGRAMIRKRPVKKPQPRDFAKRGVTYE